MLDDDYVSYSTADVDSGDVVVCMLMVVAIFFLTGCSHSMESSIGSKEQNVSIGFNVELKHTKDLE